MRSDDKRTKTGKAATARRPTAKNDPVALAPAPARGRRTTSSPDAPAVPAVPADAVTASGSGLDPHISPAYARLQAPRVAAARGVPVDVVLAAVERHTTQPVLGFLGRPGVDVLGVNLDLDRAAPVR